MLLPETIDKIKNIAIKFNVDKIILFGHGLAMTELKTDDLDLLVFGLDPMKFTDMAGELYWDDLLGKKNFRIFRSEINPSITADASDGLTIYDRNAI